MKKIISCFLILMLVFSLAACNNSNNNNNDNDNSTNQNEQNTNDNDNSNNNSNNNNNDKPIDIYEKYDPMIELSAVRNAQLADTEVDFVNSVWREEYKHTLGIDLSYKLQAFGEQYNNKINLLLASDDLADVMQVNLSQLYSMIEADQVQDLQYSWDNYATEQTKEAMTEDGTQNFDMVSRDGKLYAVPSVNPAIETAHNLFVREDWRKNLDLEVPTNMDAFEAMIYAFTNDDPDGDGEDNTYGLSLNKNLWTDGHDATTFFNCYGAYPDAWVKDGEGGLIYGGVMEGMKPALEKLAKYYEDGIINPEFTVNDQAKAGELFAQEKVGSFFGIQWAGFIGDAYNSLYTNRSGDVEAWTYRIPKATDDAGPIQYNSTRTFYVVTKDCEYPEALIKMTDLIVFMGRGPQAEGPWAIEEFGDWQTEYDAPLDEWQIAMEDKGGFAEIRDWTLLWDNWELALICPEIIHNNVQRWNWIFEAIETGDPSPMEGNYLALGMYEGYLE